MYIVIINVLLAEKDFDYMFSENGLVGYADGKPFHTQVTSIVQFLYFSQ